MINPIFLRTFMSLVKTRHFTHTAKLLNMTQPAVSQHIKKLEQHLGKPLLERRGRSFELTVIGDRLFQYGLQLAEAESDLLSAIAENDLHAGDCRLACSGSVITKFYPELLKLQKQHPGLTLSVEVISNAAVIERVKTNQSDIGIVSQPVNDPKLKQEPLGEDALCLVVPAQVNLTWQTLLQLGFINHHDGYHDAIQLLEANFSEEFQGMEQIPHSGYINQLSQVLLPVSFGLGFTVIPQSPLDVFPHPERVYNAPLAVPIYKKVYLITRNDSFLSPRYQLIIEFLTERWQ